MRSYVAKVIVPILKDDRGSSAYSFDPLFLLGNTKLSTWNKFDVYMVIPVVVLRMTRQSQKKTMGCALEARNAAACPRHTV